MSAGGLLRRVAAAVVAGVPVVAAASVSAQSAPQILTLERALEIARESNPAYRQAFNTAGLSAVEARTTLFDQVLPKANLSLLNTGFTGNLTHRATDFYGNPIQRPVSDWTYFSDTYQGLSLSWGIQGGSIVHALRRQGVTARGRDLAEAKALADVEIGVRRAYMDALEQRDLLRTEEALVEARRVDLEVANRLFTLAMKTRVDVLNAELGIEQQALAARQQRALYEKAKLALRTRLGDDELGEFELAGEPLPAFDPSMVDRETLVATALDVNPRLRQAVAAVDLARVGASEAKAAWWPTLSMSLSLSRTAQTTPTERSRDALFDLSFDEDLDSRFRIGLQIPMFNNFFQNRQRQAEAGVELDNRIEQEREARLEVEETVRGAHLELANQWESLRLAERSAEIAQEALRLAQEEYRIGTRTFEDLRQSIDAEADTRRQVIQARYSFVDALLSLEEAVGTRVAPAGAGR